MRLLAPLLDLAYQSAALPLSFSPASLPPSAASSSVLLPVLGVDHGGMQTSLEARYLLQLFIPKLWIWQHGTITHTRLVDL
uniref:Uncharacterized protein n=1 Tax=Arundo donax TaxID=35708 RepID=A0A0A9FS00_ARUDO